MAVYNQGGGQIASALAKIRKLTDEPSFRTEYPDPLLLEMLSESWQEVLTDLYNFASNKPIAAYQFDLVQDQTSYMLPGNVGEILRVACYDSDDNLEYEYIPRSHLNPAGFRIRFEGNQRLVLRWAPSASGDTITVEYVPAGDVALLSGTLQAEHTTASTLQLGNVQSQCGGLDRRPNAYLGSYLAVTQAVNPGGEQIAPTGYDHFPLQERVITGVAATTSTVTVSPDLDFTPGDDLESGALLTVEAYPIEAPLVWPVMCLHTARKMLAVKTRGKKFNLISKLYAEAKRAAALRWANLQMRTGDRFATDVGDNPEYGGFLW